MIDNDDAEFAAISSISTSGILGVLLLILAIVLYFVAAANERDCSQKACHVGHGKVVEGECLCVQLPESDHGKNQTKE